MKFPPRPGWLAFAALLALASLARATTILVPNFDSMVGQSDYIVRAVVKSVTPEWRDNPDQPGHKYIASLVELDVKEVIRGTPPSPLVLDLVGGRIGDKTLTIEGAPKFIVGEESILFVKGNGRQIVPLVGMLNGFYAVKRDKGTGRDQIVRSDGRPLYSEREIGQSDATAQTVLNPKSQPLSASDFAQRIRKSPKYISHEPHE